MGNMSAPASYNTLIPSLVVLFATAISIDNLNDRQTVPTVQCTHILIPSIKQNYQYYHDLVTGFDKCT